MNYQIFSDWCLYKFDFDACDGKNYNESVLTRVRRARKIVILLEVARQAHANTVNHGDNAVPVNIINTLNNTDFRVMEWKEYQGGGSK